MAAKWGIGVKKVAIYEGNFIGDERAGNGNRTCYKLVSKTALKAFIYYGLRCHFRTDKKRPMAN